MVSKNAKFYADFESVEKVAKKTTQKKLQANQFGVGKVYLKKPTL